MRTLIAVAFAAVATAGTLTVSSGSAQTLELKLGHVGEPGSLFQRSAEEYARIVAQRTGDKVKINVFGSSQLGGDKEMLQKLRLGTLDFSIPSTIMSSEVDLYGIFEMPYLVRDRDHMAKIEKEIFWPVLAPATEQRGYKVLAVWENGFRHITNNKRPINTPADLQGIKLRVPEGKWRVKMFQALGANPSPMKFSEVFVALQTGVMDGQENPLVQIYSAKFQEVQKYLSMTGHIYGPAFLATGAKRFAGLPKDVQQVLDAAAKETQKFVYATAAREESELLDKLISGGLQMNQANKDAFIKASQPVYEEFGKEVKGGKELVEKAIRLGANS